MRLILRAAYYHLLSQWSSQANFWSGILAIIVNNTLTLIGVWAMLFAGKPELASERNAFFIMNFVLMSSWGLVHVMTGGVADLDRQINEGQLDLAITSPRPALATVSMANSFLPGWGDVVLGTLGLSLLSVSLGAVFLIQSLLMIVFSFTALFSFFVFVGQLAFWFRRTESISSVLRNICLALNTYPLVDTTSASFRWLLFFGPVLLVGVVPSEYLVSPSSKVLGIEALGALFLLFAVERLFRWGLRRYQSTSILSLQR